MFERSTTTEILSDEILSDEELSGAPTAPGALSAEPTGTCWS
jgi:hypothetical protein